MVTDTFTPFSGEVPRREDAITPDECVGERDLRARGWTPAHMKRLLGEADLTLMIPGRYADYPAARWDRERVRWAEAVDAKLRARLAKSNPQALEEPLEPLPFPVSEHALDTLITSPLPAIWASSNGEWVVLAERSGVQDGTVTVFTRKGSAKKVAVTGEVPITWRGHDLLVIPTGRPRLVNGKRVGRCDDCRVWSASLWRAHDGSGLTGWACRECYPHPAFA